MYKGKLKSERSEFSVPPSIREMEIQNRQNNQKDNLFQKTGLSKQEIPQPIDEVLNESTPLKTLEIKKTRRKSDFQDFYSIQMTSDFSSPIDEKINHDSTLK